MRIDPNPAPVTIDRRGLTVMPGLIDTHVSHEQKGVIEQKTDSNWASLQTAANAWSRCAMRSIEANARELVAHMNETHVPAMNALIAAEALGMGDRIGSIAPGFNADIIAMNGDPVGVVIRNER